MKECYNVLNMLNPKVKVKIKSKILIKMINYLNRKRILNITHKIFSKRNLLNK